MDLHSKDAEPSPTVVNYGTLGIRVLLTSALLTAGIAEYIGAETMVASFEAVGVDQWFRHVTGLIEVGGALLLWLTGLQALTAAALPGTMIGASIAYLSVLDTPIVPALVPGLLSAVLLWQSRAQLSPSRV